MKKIQGIDKEIKKLKLEGIVAKEKKSIYEKNTRTENWVKIKNIKSEDTASM